MSDLSVNPAVVAPKIELHADFSSLGADNQQFDSKESIFNKAFENAVNSKQTQRREMSFKKNETILPKESVYDRAEMAVNRPLQVGSKDTPSSKVKESRAKSDQTDAEETAKLDSSHNDEITDSEEKVVETREQTAVTNDASVVDPLLSQVLAGLTPVSEISPADIKDQTSESTTKLPVAEINGLQVAAAKEMEVITQLTNNAANLIQNSANLKVANMQDQSQPETTLIEIKAANSELKVAESLTKISEGRTELLNSDLLQSSNGKGFKPALGDVKVFQAADEAGDSSLIVQATAKEGKPLTLNMPLIQTQLSVNNSADKARADLSLMPTIHHQAAPGTPEVSQPDSTHVTKDELFPQIVERAKVMLSNGHSEMEVHLKPEHLGKLQLKISIENQLVTAKFVAESQQIKEIIESNLNQLRRNLQENGIQVDALMVSVGSQMNGDAYREAAFAQEGFGHSGGKTGHSGNDTMTEIVPEGESNEPRAGYDSVINMIA